MVAAILANSDDSVEGAMGSGWAVIRFGSGTTRGYRVQLLRNMLQGMIGLEFPVSWCIRALIGRMTVGSTHSW